MFGPHHPLKPLANEIDAIHVRSEQGESCNEVRCTVQQIVQRNSPYTVPIMEDVMSKVRAWLQTEPLLLSYKGDAREALVTCDVGSPLEMVNCIKHGTLQIIRHFCLQWALNNFGSKSFRDSEIALQDLPLPAGAPPVLPQDIVGAGFRTAINFIGNINLVGLKLAIAAEPDASSETLLTNGRSILKNSVNITRLMASCRKDVFLELQDILRTPGQERVNSLFQTYDAEHFELVGSAQEGTLQPAIRLEELAGVRGEMHGLARMQCPSMGQTFNQFWQWQYAVYDQYFIGNIGKFREMSLRNAD